MSDSYFPTEEFARGPRPPVRRTAEEIAADYAAHMAERQRNINKYGGVELSNTDYTILNDFEKNPERYRPLLNYEDFELFAKLFPDEQNNDEFVENRYRVATAIQLAEMYDLPFRFAYSHYDDILESQYDERVRKDPKTAFKAVSDSFALGTNQKKLSGMGLRLMTLGTGKERDKLWDEIQTIKKENEELGDGVTRNWFLEGLKGLGQSWAFTASGAAAGALGGLVNPALGVVSAALVSSADMTGLEYVSLLDQGVDDATARKVAIASGAIQGIIEAGLGDVAALGSRTGIGQWIFKRLHYSGKIGAVARVLAARPIDNLMEGVEEAAQELASQAFTELAKTETEKKFGVVLGRDTPEEKRRAIVESFKGGFLTSMITGVPILLREGAVTRKEAQFLREAQLHSPDLKTLKENLTDFSGFRGMTKDTKNEIIENLWNKAEEDRNRARQAQDADNTNAAKPIDTDEPGELNPAPARRLDDGQLYYNIRTDDVEDGVAGAVMTIADTKSGKRYGTIDYHVADNSLVIDRANMSSYLTDRGEVIHDALVNLMAENRNIRDIVWETANPLEMDMRDRIIGENPFGKNLQWFDQDMDVNETRTAAAVSGQIRKTFNLDEEQTRLATHIVYRTSRALGFNPEDVIGRGLTLYTAEELRANPELAGLVSGDNGLRKDARGATFFTRDGETVGFNTVSREFEQGITGVIVAAENADLSTFVHEWMHFVDVAYIGRNGSMRRLFEEAVGKHYDEFTVDDREDLAKAFEQFLKTGDTPQSKLRNLFERIAKALSSLVKGDGVKLSPELRRAFNALFEDPASPMAQAEAAGTQTEITGEGTIAARLSAGNVSNPVQNVGETAENVSGMTENVNANSAVEDARVLMQTDAENREPTPQEIAEAKRQMDAVRRQYQGTAQWMKAPNGEPTKLTERQWVQVRTPAFKQWFGDWEVEANAKRLISDKAVTSITGEEFKKNPHKDLRTQVQEYFESIGGEVTREGLGKVLLEKGGIKSSIAHRMGRAKAAAFKAVPDIIKNGFTIDRQTNWKGRGYDSEVIAAVINIGPKEYIAEVIVNKHPDGRNTYYLHEVEEKIKLQGIIQTGVVTGGQGASKLIIAQKLEKVKGKISKIIDKNGEPKPVYHGTGMEFDEFNNESGLSAYYFTAEKRRAETYAQMKGDDNGIVMQVFLDIKNPVELSSEEIKKDVIESYIDGEHDGATSEFDNVYVAFSPTQIKSATNNAGTFSPDTGNILYQLTNDEIDAEARTFTSWREWMEYTEATDIDRNVESRVEDDGALTPEQKEAWYKNHWEQAVGIKRDGNGRVIEEKEVLESEEINDRVIDKLRNEDGVLESFLERLYYDAFPSRLDETVQTEEEAVNRDEGGRRADRIRHQVHTSILLNAERVARGRKLSPTARKQILTLMEQGAPWYRNIYAETMQDPEIDALIENEVVTLPPIEEAEERSYSIVELTRIASKIKDKEIKAKLLSGELNPGREVTEYVGRLNGEISDLQGTLRKTEEELREDEGRLSYVEKKIYEKNAAIKDLEKEVGDQEAALEKLEKRLAKAQRDRIIDQVYSDKRLRDEKAKGKVSTDERKERTAEAKTRRDAIIESFSNRVAKEYEELTKNKEKLKALRKDTAAAMREVKRDAGEGAARDVALQKRLAVDDLRAQIRMKEAEKREIQKIRDIKKKIFRAIMRGNKKGQMQNIWYEDAEKIRAIQDVVSPKIEEWKAIKWEGETYTKEEFRDTAINIVDILPKDMVRRLFKKTFDDWTISELEEFNAEIERLRYEGRKKWALLEGERRIDNSKAIRELRNEFIGNPNYVAAAAAGSEERKQQIKKQWKQGIMGFLNNTYHFDRIVDWIAGGNEDSAAYQLLIKDERKHYREKWNHVDERLEKIIKKEKELNIDVRSLYEKKHTIAGVGPENSDATFNTAELMGMYILLKNPDSRHHIVFGNLLNSQERSFYGEKEKKQIAQGIGQQKTDDLDRYVNKNLTQNEKALARAIADDFKGENFQRMADVFANEYNKRLTNVDNYLPNMVTDATGSGESHEGQQKAELLNIGGFAVKRNPEKGMTVDRIKIGVGHQRAIELDIFKLHQNGVERAEHFIAYSRYIRQLNAVLRDGSKESRALQERIEQTFGKPVMNRIKQEINIYANPQSFRDGNDKFIRALRGNLGAAYLAAKTSSILQQLATSPAPFLQEVNPAEMFASSWKYITSPKAFMENIKHMSADMRHFSGDALFDLIHDMEEDSKLKRGVKKAREIGMMGLEWANATPVFVGWNAVYEKSLKAGMTQEAAIEKADAVVRKTQPSGRPQDNSPLYRDTKEATKLLTQFGTALNAIWQQMAYDVPMAIRRKQFGTVLRIIGSYALAGTLAMALKNKWPDDDDDAKNTKRIIAWSFSQFTDSVPLLGDLITTQMEATLTGEKPRYFQSELLPAAETLIKGVGYITRKDFQKGALELAEGIGLATGLPVSGTKEAYEAISEQNLARLLGYGRKKK
jgi:hypothetical protein